MALKGKNCHDNSQLLRTECSNTSVDVTCAEYGMYEIPQCKKELPR